MTIKDHSPVPPSKGEKDRQLNKDDRKTERQNNRKTKRQKDKNTERQKDKKTERQKVLNSMIHSSR